jgi:uncharacterized phage-associated protein
MAKYTADQVADAILAFCTEHGDLITNLRLQKLLYYCQGFYLAEHGEPLFEDRIEAWIYGPAVPAVYERFRPVAHRAIDPPTTLDDQPPELVEHVKDIWEAYGHLSTYDMERISTTEPPWLNARAGLRRDDFTDAPLSLADMQTYFASQLTTNG